MPLVAAPVPRILTPLDLGVFDIFFGFATLPPAFIFFVPQFAILYHS
jgi:hypothetical protein